MQTIFVIFVNHKKDTMDLHKFVESLTSVEKAKLMHILRNSNKRLTIQEWLDVNSDLPARTLNPLRFMLKYKRGGDAIYMDELTKNKLKSLRNLGQISIDLIVERYPMS
jgi:hypothetical protein